ARPSAAVPVVSKGASGWLRPPWPRLRPQDPRGVSTADLDLLAPMDSERHVTAVALRRTDVLRLGASDKAVKEGLDLPLNRPAEDYVYEGADILGGVPPGEVRSCHEAIVGGFRCHHGLRIWGVAHHRILWRGGRGGSLVAAGLLGRTRERR